jgi:hypothetical protein
MIPQVPRISTPGRGRAQGGRFRYLWRGVLSVTLLGVGNWLIAKLIALWLFGKAFDLTSGIPMLPVFPVVAWLVLRQRWGKNKERYGARVGGDSS